MSKKPLTISESAAVQMPMKTVASLIIIVALGTMGYFQMVERLNIADTKIKIMEQDVEQNTEFRIKWPRGQMGSLPADSEQYMMLEDLYKTTDRINKHIEDMALNKVNIEFLTKQMDKVLSDIEKLKDANRDIKYNGNGSNNYKNLWLRVYVHVVLQNVSLIRMYLTNVYAVRQRQRYTWVKNQSRNYTSNENYSRDSKR